MAEKHKIIVVCGPTASGKTYTAIELAKLYNGEIISADSAQVYRELNIGTAKPTEEEMQGIKHHLIDIASVKDINKYSVADYVSQAEKCVQEIIKAGRLPIICGGTGLYIDHFMKNTKFVEYDGDKEYRSELEKLSNEELHGRLSAIDKSSAEVIHMNNRRRVIRALEMYRITGKTKTELDGGSQLEGSRYDFLKFGLRYNNRDLLYQRINARTDEMIERGLYREVVGLYKSGCGDDIKKLGIIGYNEFIEFLEDIEKVDYNENDRLFREAVDNIKQNTRNYAKRQITWFKRDTNTVWIDIDEEIIKDMRKIIKNCINSINIFEYL